MSYLSMYAFIATIIAVMSIVDLYHPVMQTQSKEEMSLEIRLLHYLVWFVIAFLTAPALLYPCINKLKGVEFRDGLKRSLFSDK